VSIVPSVSSFRYLGTVKNDMTIGSSSRLTKYSVTEKLRPFIAYLMTVTLAFTEASASRDVFFSYRFFSVGTALARRVFKVLGRRL